MNNPATKGRELLKAARSQVMLKKPEPEVSNKPDHEQQKPTIIIEQKIEKNEHSQVPEVSNSISKRLEMFSTKSKLVTMNYDQNNINTNKIKLLNRMNKDTAITITNPKPLTDTNEIIHDTHSIELDTHNNFQIKTGDKEKLMKKISTAKGILKSSTNANMTNNPSGKIMDMAALLNNKLNLGSGPIKFSSNDDDIQQVEEEKPTHESSNHTKNVDDILMDKPINKNIRKKTLTKFVLEK